MITSRPVANALAKVHLSVNVSTLVHTGIIKQMNAISEKTVLIKRAVPLLRSVTEA